MDRAVPRGGGGGGGVSRTSVICLRSAVCLLGVICVILLAVLSLLLQHESIHFVHPGGSTVTKYYFHAVKSWRSVGVPDLEGRLEVVTQKEEEEEEEEEKEMRLHANMSSAIQTSPLSSSSSSAAFVSGGNVDTTKQLSGNEIATKRIGEDVLVRVVHPSGSGGTTLCKLIKKTQGARMSRFQRDHNCNENGSGPKTSRRMRPDSPWRRCDFSRTNGARTYNWLFFEYAFDADYPCAQNENVKHVMLFRDPWERLYSITMKIRSEEKIHKYMYYFSMLEKHGKPIDVPGDVLKRIDNSLIRFMLGRDMGLKQIPFGGITRAHLEAAKTIVDGFDVVIETGDLGDVSVYLSELFGEHLFTFPEFPKRENTHTYPPKPQGYDRLKYYFDKWNKLEMEFYDYLVSIKAKRNDEVVQT